MQELQAVKEMQKIKGIGGIYGIKEIRNIMGKGNERNIWTKANKTCRQIQTSIADERIEKGGRVQGQKRENAVESVKRM